MLRCDYCQNEDSYTCQLYCDYRHPSCFLLNITKYIRICSAGLYKITFLKFKNIIKKIKKC